MLDRAWACVCGRAVFFFRRVGVFFREPARPALAGGWFGTLSLHVYILVSFLIEYLMLFSISFRFGPSARFGGRIVGDPSLDIGAVDISAD